MRSGFCFVLRVLQPAICQERFFASAMPCHPPCAESKSSKAYAVRCGFYFATLATHTVRVCRHCETCDSKSWQSINSINFKAKP
ncbi:hypothetical protein [Campylobacter troglodytis]|uniref:hypothetical protein n=1 Tax=Campylobacter troglodytis TaxID=654363 RepID=UPI00115991E5|nr:hypothetical protein [Campylobacter troglodytis]